MDSMYPLLAAASVTSFQKKKKRTVGTWKVTFSSHLFETNFGSSVTDHLGNVLKFPF